jgi:hypothetical protein
MLEGQKQKVHSLVDKVYRADSILVQLPDREFEEGLAALRKHALEAKDADPVVEPVDFFVFQT